MRHATLRNTTICYDRMGFGHPLLLLHGLGERKEGWIHQYGLSDTYDLIIPDLRGHGDSTSSGEISITAFAADILELMDTLEIESAHICGLSMGGVVAQEIYRMAPQRCTSLILASTYFYIPPLWQAPLYLSWLWRTYSTPQSMRMPLAAATCLANGDAETVGVFQKAIEPNPHTFWDTLESCLRVNNIDLLSQIRVPTQIIAGDRDLVTPAWNQVMMHHMIPESQLAIVRRAGHMVKLDQPEEFNCIIRNFLSSQKTHQEIA